MDVELGKVDSMSNSASRHSVALRNARQMEGQGGERDGGEGGRDGKRKDGKFTLGLVVRMRARRVQWSVCMYVHTSMAS